MKKKNTQLTTQLDRSRDSKNRFPILKGAKRRAFKIYYRFEKIFFTHETFFL